MSVVRILIMKSFLCYCFRMKDWQIYSLLALIFWGLWAFLPRFAVVYIQPRSLTLYQTVGIVLGVLVILSLSSWKLETHPVGIFIGILSGALGIFGTFFYNMALRKGQASVVLTMTALYPLVALILVFLFFREMITWKQGIGIVMALVAMILIAS